MASHDWHWRSLLRRYSVGRAASARAAEDCLVLSAEAFMAGVRDHAPCRRGARDPVEAGSEGAELTGRITRSVSYPSESSVPIRWREAAWVAIGSLTFAA